MAHPDNSFYGHNRLLAEYAGVGSRPPIIRGHVQHGWMQTTGLARRARLVSWLPKFVWSAHNRKCAEELGIGPVEVIAAPFCYLDAASAPAPPAPRSTIYYPFHGWDRDDVLGSHHDLIAAIQEREEGPVTICLYWREFDQPRVRRVYEAAGYRVICHGYRHDPLFVMHQRDELLRHDRVASNRVGTALWYGGYMSRSIEVYGPIFSVESEEEARRFDRYQRDRWPELFSGGVEASAARELAGEELGAAFVLPPDELREVLGWSPRELRYAPGVKAAARADHHLRRLAYNVAARLPGTTLPRF